MTKYAKFDTEAEEIRVQKSTVYDFYAECLEYCEDGGVPPRELYPVYVAWATYRGSGGRPPRPVNSQVFISYLETECGMKRVRGRDDRRTVRWANTRVKPSVLYDFDLDARDREVTRIVACPECGAKHNCPVVEPRKKNLEEAGSNV